MILVTARLAARPDARNELVRLLIEVRDATLAEEGCVNYGYYAALDDPNEIVAVEEWRDEAALQAHFGEPHVAKLMSEAPGLLAAAPEIVAHEVSGSRPLGAR
ncbi:MAG: putative quinol monooxygenase [Solirubrobacteraceae bacterium]